MELKTINLSLTTLGKVIAQLSKGKSKSNSNLLKGDKEHIPYRESNLTRILQDSLGGNTNTWIIATISPWDNCTEESLSTLKFADRAKQVMQRVKINKIFATNDKLVNKLQSEIKHLREVLNIRRNGGK